MDSEKNKPILIGVAVVCVLAAGVIAYLNFGGGGGSSVSTEPIPMLCTACGHSWDMPFKDYQQAMSQGGVDPMMMMGPMQQPKFDCPKCGKKAAMMAIKCNHCGAYFIADYQRNPELKCPKCGKSN